MKKILDCDLGSLKVGERAKVLVDKGEWKLTSPVQEYSVHGSVVYIKTENSVYMTEEKRQEETFPVEKRCPFCGNVSRITLKGEEIQEYHKYLGGEYIQNCFPGFTPQEREFFITGYCLKCQEFIFGPAKVISTRFSE